MAGARASSKQQQQAVTSPAGPRAGPTATGSRNGKVMFPEQLFFLARPPPAGNSNLVVFGPILGFWQTPGLGKKPQKTQLPGARGGFRGEIRPPKKFLSENARPLKKYDFADRDPHGGKLRNWVFGPLWPRTAFGTYRNSGRKTENRNC